MYSLATATAWILFVCLGTVRFTVCLSSSDRIEGIFFSSMVYRPRKAALEPAGWAVMVWRRRRRRCEVVVEAAEEWRELRVVQVLVLVMLGVGDGSDGSE
jgi:hypothetical protein